MDISAAGYRLAFCVWLRTGRWLDPDRVEVKFNPWHDPDDGRFTFAYAGGYFPRDGDGSGGSASGSGDERSSGQAGAHRSRTRRRSPTKEPSFGRQAPSDWIGGGFTGGGGGSFGGAGAGGSWRAPSAGKTQGDDPSRSQASAILVRATAPSRVAEQPVVGTPAASSVAEPWQKIVRNGYTYEIDTGGRTRRVSGALTTTETPVRSRRVQAEAGGVDRRQRDDGGHYIAPRFNGPAEAFNHFAHDSNANRGRYRVLEDEWARAKRHGKHVAVKIVPSYDDISSRPSSLNVWFTIDGKLGSQSIPNESAEKARAKR